MADNTITLVGNLTRDPELRYTTGGRGVASFGLAVNRRYQVNGEWQEQTSFFNVVAWGNSARTPRQRSPRAAGPSCSVVSSSAAGRPRTARSAASSKSSPTSSARACAGRRRRSSATSGRPPKAASGWRWRRRWRRRGAGASSGGGSRQPDPVYGDEEPF